MHEKWSTDPTIYDADSAQYQNGEGRPWKCKVHGCPDDEDMTFEKGYCNKHEEAMT